jgi:hypothetical protein
MDLDTILIIVGVGAVVSIIGGWAIIYYATLRHEDYQEYDDNKPKLTTKEKNELKQWIKNQDKDAPF